jgi:tetratricopeptide (TPR) repeat protein
MLARMASSRVRAGLARRARRDLAAAGAALTLLAGVARARADEPADPAVEASRLAEQGRIAFEQGHADRAIELAEEAYRLKRDPILLYNIARGYEQLGRLTDAIAAYRRFLAASPDLASKPAMEQRIATLQRLIDERAEITRSYAERLQELQRRQRAIIVAPPAHPGPWATVGGIVAGVGASALVGATVLWLSADHEHDVASSLSTSGVETSTDVANARTLALAGNVAVGVGGALIAGGVALIIAGTRKRPVDLGAKSFAWAPRGAGLVATF